MRTWFPLMASVSLSASLAQAQIGDVQRANLAKQIRIDAADYQRSRPLPAHPNNGDEAAYATSYYLGNYTKGLPHDGYGRVDPIAYQTMLNALQAGTPAALETIPLGGTRKLVNPQAAYSFTLEGPDPQGLAIRPAPAYASYETAGEMEELYWMSLIRDVNFDQYGTSSTVADAAERLGELRDYRGAKGADGLVSTDIVFRADQPGATQGPFLSQFLVKDIPFSSGPFVAALDEPTGYQVIEQRNLVRFAGDDRVTQYGEWLQVQNGDLPFGVIDQRDEYEAQRRYIRNARDLAEYVHSDYPVQAPLTAALLLARQGDFLANGAYDPDGKSTLFAADELSPYRQYLKQDSFVTLGNSDAQSATALITNTALRAQWYQKWLVHRRLRPEEFGGHVHNRLVGGEGGGPFNISLLVSPVLDRVFYRNEEINLQRLLLGGGTYLLSQTFPEGSPLHPAYGSGHSTYMGAGVTMIKAFYKDFPVRNPKVVTNDGLSLAPYTGGTLMMFDELDKLVSNIGVGRLFAGVHWRSDHDHAVRLGELVALRTLQDQARLYNEQFPGFQVRTFGGNTLTITATTPALPSAVAAVVGFSLIDTDTGQTVTTLYNGSVIDLSDLAASGVTHVAVQANTFESVVGSVRFSYDGTASTDNSAPYRLASTLAVGTHVLRATPFSESNGNGLGGVPFVIRFTVQN